MTYTGKPTRVAVAGTGWRAEFFMRICAALPERFELCGIMYHSDKGRASVADRGVPLVSTLDGLAALPEPACDGMGFWNGRYYLSAEEEAAGLLAEFGETPPRRVQYAAEEHGALILDQEGLKRLWACLRS